MKANKGDTITINKPGHLIHGVAAEIKDITPENDRPIKVSVHGDWFLTWDEIIPAKDVLQGIIISDGYSDTTKGKKSLKHAHSNVIMASDGVSTIIKTENAGNSIDNLTYIAPLPFELSEKKKRGRPKVNKPEPEKPKRTYKSRKAKA